MSIFSTKKSQAAPEVKSNESDSSALQEVNENIYKHSLELAEKNKTLSLLSQLYSLSVLTLDTKELAEKMSKTIQSTLGFELVGIFSINPGNNSLEPFKFSFSERLSALQIDPKTSIDSVVVPNFLDKSFFKKIFETKGMVYTENLKDVWGDLLPGDMMEKMAVESYAKLVIGYPLVTGSHEIGIVIFILNRTYENVAQYERDLINSFINVISVALDKAMLYEQLTVSNSKLKEANQGQASLMHFMNHQIKGRLGNTKNIFAELLTDDYGVMPDFAKSLLEKGLDESTIGINYVQNILKGASAENGTLPYDMKPMDLKPVVENVASKQKEYAEKKGLAFNLEILEGDYNITGDEMQLGEAIKNLIDNSVNYTPKGSINVTMSNAENRVQIKVKDTGVGIADGDKDKLFKSGGRGADSVKINTNSTGYGLVFVKGVIEAHKGKVWAESEGCDKGSTFYIEIPKS